MNIDFKKLSGFGIVLTFLVSCQPDNKKNINAIATDTSQQQVTPWDTSYGGADKSYDLALLALRDEVAPKFKKLVYKDEVTGREMNYNLYIPKNYDQNKHYPLVQFIADASTVGKGIEAPLKQGYGGIIWATDESQAQNPSFVLVPSFEGPQWPVNDDWQTSEEVEIAYRLLNNIINTYSIDQDSIYTTGQSMGGMISFYLNATHPNLFAASIFVGSQWDINVLSPLTDATFFYIVSAGDEKASKGMQQVGEMLSQHGIIYGLTSFSARLPQLEQDQKVETLINQGYHINFVQFDKGTVILEGTDLKNGAEHMYSFDYAYKLSSVRDWLFKQKKS